MASQAFKDALRSTKETKNLDTILVGGSGAYLPEGPHDVRITSVGPASDREGNVSDGQVAITYEGPGGKTYNDRVYLISADGSELSFGVRMLLSAVIPNTKLVEKFFEVGEAEGEKVLEMFTGMQLRITLAYGKGYQVRATGSGKFAAYELDNKGKSGPPITEEFDDISLAKDAAQALGYKRSYLRVKSMECTHAEANANAFNTAVAGKN